jgi:hypothetical protein
MHAVNNTYPTLMSGKYMVGVVVISAVKLDDKTKAERRQAV